MATYQNKKSKLSGNRFRDIFKDLSKESQLRLIETLSKIKVGVRL